jgi:hypothetical protein
MNFDMSQSVVTLLEPVTNDSFVNISILFYYTALPLLSQPEFPCKQSLLAKTP